MSNLYIGGVHLPRRSASVALAQAPLPQTLSLPIPAIDGVFADPIVSVGDTVLCTQLLTCSDHENLAMLHAPMHSVVQSIENHCITLKKCDEERWHPACVPFSHSLSDATADQLFDHIEATGLTAPDSPALSLASLLRKMHGKVHTVVLNAVDDQPTPYASHLLLSYPEQIIAGWKLMLRILGCHQGILAIGSDQKRALAAISPLLSDQTMLSVRKLRPIYPISHPRHLILSLFRVEQKRGKELYDTGYAVFSPDLLLSLYDAFTQGMPLIERTVLVSGDLLCAPTEVILPIGTRIGDLLSFLSLPSSAHLSAGNGEMRARAIDVDSVIEKNTTRIFVSANPPKSDEDLYRITGSDNTARSCIGCGDCFSACPSEIDLPRLIRRLNAGKTDGYAPMDFCIGCGCCRYICPIRIDVFTHLLSARAAEPRLEENQTNDLIITENDEGEISQETTESLDWLTTLSAKETNPFEDEDEMEGGKDDE